jgi:hypothetical protein
MKEKGDENMKKLNKNNQVFLIILSILLEMVGTFFIIKGTEDIVDNCSSTSIANIDTWASINFLILMS